MPASRELQLSLITKRLHSSMNDTALVASSTKMDRARKFDLVSARVGIMAFFLLQFVSGYHVLALFFSQRRIQSESGQSTRNDSDVTPSIPNHSIDERDSIVEYVGNMLMPESAA
jgi:hypothetical protein